MMGAGIKIGCNNCPHFSEEAISKALEETDALAEAQGEEPVWDYWDEVCHREMMYCEDCELAEDENADASGLN